MALGPCNRSYKRAQPSCQAAIAKYMNTAWANFTEDLTGTDPGEDWPAFGTDGGADMVLVNTAGRDVPDA